MFGRRHAKTRRELVRSEFGESMDHARQAAMHAAEGLGATVGPNYGKAKDRMVVARDWMSPKSGKVTNAASTSWDATAAAFAPLMQAARVGALRAGRLEARSSGFSGNGMTGNGTKRVRKVVEKTSPERHVSGTVVALVATGAAVGAAGALAARRRNRVKWSEYEPSQLHSDAKDLLDSSSTATTSLSSSAREMGESGTIKKAAGWTKGQAQKSYDSVRHKIHKATEDHPVGDLAESAKQSAGGMAEEARGSARKGGEHLNEGANHFGDKAKDKMNEAASRSADSVGRGGK